MSSLTYDFDNGPSVTIDSHEPIAIVYEARQEMQAMLVDYLRGIWAEVRSDDGQRALMDRLLEAVEGWNLKPSLTRDRPLGRPQ